MKQTTINLKDLITSGHRLDASFHASTGMQVLKALKHWEVQEPQIRRLDLIKDVCISTGVFIPSRFKRVYVQEAEHGERWLSPSDMLKADLNDLPLISRKLTTNIDTLRIHHRWILLSRSGTIGNLAYVRRDMEGLVASDDIIRIIPQPAHIAPGYLYAFLSSSIGQALIEQQIYGAVIPHIEVRHITSLPIPRLSTTTEYSIHELIEKSSSLRVDANNILKEVKEQFDKAVKPLASKHSNKQLGFIVPSSEITRLTASSNTPAVKAVIQAIINKNRFSRLKDVTQRIFHPFRINMVYASKGHGIPFLNLADMLANQYRTSKFISPLTADFKEYLINYGWCLMSRSGTIGKVTFSGQYLENTAAGEHIIRYVPDTTKIPVGYLYAFLTSDYAQLQIASLTYGSVIQGIYERDIGEMLIPLLDNSTMQNIGRMVEQAFDYRFKAIKAEDQAQQRLDAALTLNIENSLS